MSNIKFVRTAKRGVYFQLDSPNIKFYFIGEYFTNEFRFDRNKLEWRHFIDQVKSNGKGKIDTSSPVNDNNSDEYIKTENGETQIFMSAMICFSFKIENERIIDALEEFFQFEFPDKEETNSDDSD